MFSKLFKKKNKMVPRPEPQTEEEYTQNAYYQEPDVTINKSVGNKQSTRDLISGLCEQMVSCAREMDTVKQEYRLVTAYLNDIQIIENLSPEEKEPIVANAREIIRLNQARQESLNYHKKLADVQYEQMRDMEKEVPGAIERLKKNEIYLQKVEKDLKYLEGEKLHQTLHRQDVEWEHSFLKKVVIFTLFLFSVSEVGVFLLRDYFGFSWNFVNLMVIVLCLMCVVYSVVRIMTCNQEIRQCEINRNYAVTLENHAKIRFVNTTNAINYVKERYHVENSTQLEEMYENYQEAVREQKRLEMANADLDYYQKELIKQLSGLWLYDAKVWINHADALVDAREMVEMRHKLVARRQRVRARLEEGKESVEQIQKEIQVNMHLLGDLSVEMKKIVDRMQRFTLSC